MNPATEPAGSTGAPPPSATLADVRGLRAMAIAMVAGLFFGTVAPAAPADAGAGPVQASTATQRTNLRAATAIDNALRSPVAAPSGAELPSRVALRLVADAGVVLTDVQRRDLQRLDRLEGRQRSAVAAVLSKFIAYRATASTAPLTSDEVLWSKVDLLRAGAALGSALAARASKFSCTPVQVSFVVSISLARCDDTYTVDTWLVVDGGGNDTYANNAGGGHLRAAALFEFGGNDRYVGHGPGPLFSSQGVNGGGSAGSGFLLDTRGNDSYFSAGPGANGGGGLGSGFLVDAAGHDEYLSRPWDPQYGSAVNGGGGVGRGFLLDLGVGNDLYEATDVAVNGGAVGALLAWAMTAPASGFLLDQGGHDRYLSGEYATNGGSVVGDGMLVDRAGDDRYVAGLSPEGYVTATNGGSGLGTAKLVDLAGRDFYDDGASSGWDQTVAVKGAAGTQVDVPDAR